VPLALPLAVALAVLRSGSARASLSATQLPVAVLRVVKGSSTLGRYASAVLASATLALAAQAGSAWPGLTGNLNSKRL